MVLTVPDLLDISHHQRDIDWQRAPLLPIVHKVNEGRAVDRKIVERLPIIAGRTEIFGGYTVLIVSSSTIRQQIEQYARIIEPHWRPGAFTQLDVEPWAGYPRAVNHDEIAEAQAVHDELLGADRLAVYINPNQLSATFREWRKANPDRPLWLPNYSKNGPAKAAELDATLHQYTSSWPAAGIGPGGIDANTIRKPDTLQRICALAASPPKEPTMPPVLIRPANPVFKTRDGQQGIFTIDGQPVSPETAKALTDRGAVIIDQDHPWWDEATLHKIGEPARRLYGDTPTA